MSFHNATANKILVVVGDVVVGRAARRRRRRRRRRVTGQFLPLMM